METLELYGQSDFDIAAEIGRRFREYRIALRLTQADVARQSGISVMTLVRFENGRGQKLRMNNFIALMRALQLLENIAEIIPDMPPSLYRPAKKTVQRVRRKRDEQ